MSAQDNLHRALLSAFTMKLDDTEDAPAAARAFTDILCAFAEVVRGPLPAVAGVELTADETPALILAEMKAQTVLLRSLSDAAQVGGVMTLPVV